MKFRYKIILALTLSSVIFNLIFGFFAIQKELGGEKERYKNKIEHYNTLMELMNVRPLWDYDSEKIRSNLELIFRDPEVVSVKVRDVSGTINIELRKENPGKNGKISLHHLNIVKENEKLGEAQIEYSNSIYRSRFTALIIERIILTLGLIIFNTVIVFFISSFLLRPIDSVVRGLKKIDDGDFNFRMNINTVDEFKQIEKYFNRMAATLSNEILSRIEKEEQLVEFHKYLKNVFNSMPSVLITVDQSGFIDQWNYAAEKFTGISSSGALRRSVWVLVPILDVYRNAFNAVLQEEKTEEIRRQYVSPENDLYLNISISPLISEKVSGAVIRIDDVTEIKLMDEKLSHAQMMDTIGNLAGGLAHDFNNVLAGITGTVSLIKFRMQRGEEISVTDFKKFINIIGDSGDRAAELTRQILSLSRKENMNFGIVDLNLIMKHVIQLCNHTLDKSVEIKPVYTSTDALVLADPIRLEQVLLNLCINASDAMTVMRGENETKGGTIIIDLQKHTADEFFCNSHVDASPGAEYWRMSVMDNGVGIEKKVLTRIFEPFFTTKRKGNGTGLGLSMSYRIIKQHSGFIDLYSEPGSGSIFSVYIPVNESEMKDNEVAEKGIHHGSGLILVVDDEKSMCETASNMLQILGYDVITYDDPEEGIEIFKEKYKIIKAVLLDMIMPKKTGCELFTIFREISPSIPVVITSGFGIDENIEKILKERGSFFIQKPFSIEDLAVVIGNALNLSDPGSII